MSSNITAWKTIELRDLRIPMDLIEPHTEVRDVKGQTRCRLGEFGGIRGNMDDIGDEDLCVSSIDISGEHSGSDFEVIVLPALRESSGFLKARICWEGGESVEILTVNDGEITREDL